MSSLRHYLATSGDALPRGVRKLRRALRRVSLPVPRTLSVPLCWGYDAARELYWLARQHLVCEPYLKAHCARHGRRLQTGTFLHYVMGRGDIVVGDDVLLDGHVVITFAARFADRPTLEIGDGVSVGHGCTFTVGKRITLGSRVLISPGVILFDSPGHPSDAAARGRGEPPPDESVRPITVGDDVWIGMGSMVYPGVTIGEGSVIAAGSVVMSDVPPYSVVSGNPARRIAVLRPAQAGASEARLAGEGGLR